MFTCGAAVLLLLCYMFDMYKAVLLLRCMCREVKGEEAGSTAEFVYKPGCSKTSSTQPTQHMCTQATASTPLKGASSHGATAPAPSKTKRPQHGWCCAGLSTHKARFT